MSGTSHINKMASLYRHATLLTCINHNLFVCVLVLLSMPMAYEGAARFHEDRPSGDEGGRRLTKEYHLRQGALRGFIVKPSRNYQLQNVEIFLGIPYAAPPVGNLRFMPPGNALPWSGVKLATRFGPVCPQTLPPMKKDNPPSLGRQNYMSRIQQFLKNEAEDCLYLNIYVPYREQKPKKFPVLVFMHGDSFEWGSGNPYDSRILSAYGNIMVVTVNFRLGILGFMKPSLTEHVYGNNGLLDQLAALQWIKDNIQDLNGDPNSVTLMGHDTGAACINFLMISPISNGLFHRAILMSGSALSDWALTKDPDQYTLQVAQSLKCNLNSREMMSCLQNKTVADIKRVQILAREFETPLGPVVAGSFIPNEPTKTMEAFPNLLSKYQLLSGVTEIESYHDFGVIELAHGVLDLQRNDYIKKYAKVIYDGAEDVAVKEIMKHYSTTKLDPSRWTVEANRDCILNIFSDARTVAPVVKFANFQSQANSQSYFYVFGHNSEGTEYAPLRQSVHGEELPYVFGVPLGGANTHFHSEYTQKEKLLSEVIMRLWTNFVKLGTPNTQRTNEYYTIDRNEKSEYNIEWPEYNVDHQSFLRLDIPPRIRSFYRSNYTKFWLDSLPNKMKRYVVETLFDYTPPAPSTLKPKQNIVRTPNIEVARRYPPAEPPHYNQPIYGYVRPHAPPQSRPDPDVIYREIQAIKNPARPVPPNLMEKPSTRTTPRTIVAKNVENPNSEGPVKSSSTITIVAVLGFLFLIANVIVCSILYFKRRKLQLRERTFETSRNSRGDIDMCDGVLKVKEDKAAMKKLKNGCSVLKSMSMTKIRNNSSKTKKSKHEPCKTPKSDDSGGFRERFQLRRHLSTSTLDAHTKVRDWIANEVMHRCSPRIIRKSNSEVNDDKQMSILKPYTRSEEILSDSKNKKRTYDPKHNNLHKNVNLIAKTSEKTTSTSALGSHSSIDTKQSTSLSSVKLTAKSNDSLKSRGTESVKSKKVSVAIDATPAARTNSILKQEPIEVFKSLERAETLSKHSNDDTNSLKRPKTEKYTNEQSIIINDKPDNKENDNKTFTSVVNLAVKSPPVIPLTISHKHSRSDPVTDTNYGKIKNEDFAGQNISIPPPALFGNDINVTSREENIQVAQMSAAEALLTIQRRNYPKVLPDLPTAQKRLSLQSTSFHTFRNFGSSFENTEGRSKVPPQPPPRTTTLDRRVAYKNTKPINLSSFDASGARAKSTEVEYSKKNYENIDSLAPVLELNSTENSTPICDKFDTSVAPRDYPKVIIASSDIPANTESKIIIKASSSQSEIPSNVPRVKLPDDFHSQTTGSITSCSSFCSDDDDVEFMDEDFIDDLADDKLIQELVGGVESPTNLECELDSKGPETIFEKKLEIIPVKLNTGIGTLRNKENYVCISNLLLPDVSDLERTAQIRPNFGLNKLQSRSESINRPPEKAVKVKPKKNIKPTTILNRSLKSKSSKTKAKNNYKSDASSLEHSNSGSSNDTASSTGTVKKVELKKDTT